MKELVEVMAKSLVSNPSAVVVEEETTGTLSDCRWLKPSVKHGYFAGRKFLNEGTFGVYCKIIG